MERNEAVELLSEYLKFIGDKHIVAPTVKTIDKFLETEWAKENLPIGKEFFGRDDVKFLNT